MQQKLLMVRSDIPDTRGSIFEDFRSNDPSSLDHYHRLVLIESAPNLNQLIASKIQLKRRQNKG